METEQNQREIRTVIESLVTLTAQRDQYSLEESLVVTLSTLLGARCQVISVPDNYAPELAHRRNHPQDDTELSDRMKIALARIIHESQPIALPEGDATHYLIKLHSQPREGHRILSVQAKCLDTDAHKLIVGLATVYRNFVDLLSDNEHDTLTGLFNRKKLEASLNTVCALATTTPDEAGADLGNYLAILDLDRFKRINDSFGHLIGDEVLLIFADILRHTLRTGDMIFRYGGEEFMILLRDVTLESAHAILERARENVAQHTFPQVGQVTTSIGFRAIAPLSMPSQVIEEADRALYFAKENGRNQVREYRSLVDAGLLEDVHTVGSVELF